MPLEKKVHSTSLETHCNDQDCARDNNYSGGGLWFTGVVRADHYDFSAADPDKHNPGRSQGASGDINSVYRYWGLQDSDMLWASSADIKADVIKAIDDWTAAVPQLTWQEVPLEFTLVVFHYQPCPNAPNAVGCVARKPPPSPEWHYDNDRDATYWQTAPIYINPNTVWSGDSRRSTIAHEIGHLYGLHERYVDADVSDCTASEITIMDAAIFDPATGWTYPCDYPLVGPSAKDDSRATTFYSRKDVVNTRAVASGSIGVYRWESKAWAAYYHRVDFQYQDPVFLNWTTYQTKDRTADIGLRRITEKGYSRNCWT